MLGKKSSQKSVKTRFLYSHDYRDQKNGGKNARYKFSRNTKMRTKYVGKKIVAKIAKTRFLFSHEYRDVKIGGKTLETIFPEKTRILRAKNVGKKITSKKCENTFYILT